MATIDLLVAPLPDTRAAQWAVDALAAGAAAICRTLPFGDSQGEDPADLLPGSIRWYGHGRELAEIVSGLVGDADAFRSAAIEATALVRRSHRLADRVRSVHELVVGALVTPARDGQVACKTDH